MKMTTHLHLESGLRMLRPLTLLRPTSPLSLHQVNKGNGDLFYVTNIAVSFPLIVYNVGPVWSAHTHYIGGGKRQTILVR